MWDTDRSVTYEPQQLLYWFSGGGDGLLQLAVRVAPWRRDQAIRQELQDRRVTLSKVRLWSVRRDDGGLLVAHDVPSIANTETEELFETLLVRSPDLLMDGLTLIGRQVPTEGGYLDLLGLDQDGRVVVFELKRGSLTREAVAQLLDYTSDLSSMDADRLAKLVEDTSGQGGVDRIEDFADWYSQTFPDREGVMQDPPRMILVGLEVDPRALRIVNFLAQAGIDVSLLTFHAFTQDDSLFLARQVESVAPKSMASESSSSPTKVANLQALCAYATQRGAWDLIQEVAEFIEHRTPAYKWPGKTGYAFSLTEYTELGRPSLRVYVNVSLDCERQRTVSIVFQERAVQAIGAGASVLTEALPGQCSINKYNGLEVNVPEDKWTKVKSLLEEVLKSMIEGWKVRTSGQQSQAAYPDVEESAPSEPVGS